MNQSIDRPVCAAKRLRDMAISAGCQDNIAVLVVVLSISSTITGNEKIGSVVGSFRALNELSGLRRSGRILNRTKFEGIQEM